MVGESAEWIPDIVEKTRGLTVGPGFENKDIAPMNNKAALQRAEKIISSSETDGSKILLDGRGVKVAGYENGNWLGPTIIDHAGPGMPCYDDEIFAPVMVICRAKTIDEAIKLVNSHHFGNGVAIFTKSGGHARKF
jgi:malonate-semialdehyde dehydrogenase (acetylating)/methylmalonate-semialdehyde dehydrogenase